MKQLIGAVVLHLQVYSYTYLLSFAEADRCCFCTYLSQRLFILSKQWQRLGQPRRNAQTFLKDLNPEAVWRIVFIGLTGIMLTEEAVDSPVGALRSLPPRVRPAIQLKRQRLWSSCASRCQKARGLRSVVWCPIWRKCSPKPTQRAGLACLAAAEICVKRCASNAQVGEQPSQRKQMWLEKKVYGFLFTSEVFERPKWSLTAVREQSRNARTREADQECLQLLGIRFHKLWNWKFTLRMNLFFQFNTRQLFRPFGYSSVVHDTFFFGMLCVAKPMKIR